VLLKEMLEHNKPPYATMFGARFYCALTLHVSAPIVYIVTHKTTALAYICGLNGSVDINVATLEYILSRST
jgi:hypothetical protein